MRRELGVVQSHAATPAPDSDKNSYGFHGFVRNRQQQPQPGLSVAFYDDKGRWFRDADFGCTDNKGYFLIRYERPASFEKPGQPAAGDSIPAKSGTPSQAVPDPKAREQPAEPAKASDAQNIETTKRAFEVRVYNSDPKLVHREARPVTIEFGQIDFREIVIGDEGSCTPPPDGPDDPPPSKPRKYFTAALITGAAASVFKCKSS